MTRDEQGDLETGTQGASSPGPDLKYRGALNYFDQACRDLGISTWTSSVFGTQHLGSSGKSGQGPYYSSENH
jgi:hypothetical protein